MFKRLQNPFFGQIQPASGIKQRYAGLLISNGSLINDCRYLVDNILLSIIPDSMLSVIEPGNIVINFRLNWVSA